MTQVALILLVLAAVGAASIVTGVAVLAGAGWALVAGGVLAIVAAVVLLDPAELQGGKR